MSVVGAGDGAPAPPISRLKLSRGSDMGNSQNVRFMHRGIVFFVVQAKYVFISLTYTTNLKKKLYVM